MPENVKEVIAVLLSFGALGLAVGLVLVVVNVACDIHADRKRRKWGGWS